MLERAAATLDEHERSWLTEARQLLIQHEHTFCTSYPEALHRELTATQEEDARKPGTLSFESLELMGDDQVDETVEVQRAQEAVLANVESELAQLNALVSAARGQQVVSASHNPLRPKSWVRALRDATLACAVPAPVRVRWLNQMSEPLGAELARVYLQLSDLLRSRGVTAAGFRVNVVSSRESAAGAPQKAPAAGPAWAQPSSGERAGTPTVPPLLNLRDLKRLLTPDRPSHDGSRSGGDTLVAPRSESADTGMTVPWAFEALQDMKQVKVDQLLQRMQHRRRSHASVSASGAAPGDAASLAGGSITPAGALSQEVVRLMIENISADPRLLPAVQQAVRMLEPALLRLAQHDRRFFNDKQHPARQFLTELTQRSLAWPSADAPGFAVFFQPLREAVEALAALPMEDADPFEFALASLQQVWAEHEEALRRERAKAAQAMIKAEKRNLLAERLAEDLRGRPDMAAAPTEVKRFITGPWSQVLAAARLADTSGASDPGGYAAIINDLIWTTQPRLAAQNPARLAKLAPPVLAMLRRGLASIQFPQQEAEAFIRYVADKHQISQRSLAAADAGVDAVDGEPRSEPKRPEVWLKPAEALDSDLMQFADIAPRREETEAPPIATVKELVLGVWVDLFLDRSWSRWQLTWATPHSLLFMFTDANGKSRSITRSMLEKLLAFGAVRIVAQQTLVDGALDAVAERALHNSANLS